VHAERDTRQYPTGVKISDGDMKDIEKNKINRHEFHGEWNYTRYHKWNPKKVK